MCVCVCVCVYMCVCDRDEVALDSRTSAWVAFVWSAPSEPCGR